LRILITGASGFIGSSLVAYLEGKGHSCLSLSRGCEPPNEPIDACIHLAGEPLTLGRWSARKKKEILSSRREGTLWLISRLSHLPKVFISASAVGYYGNRGEELLDEQSGPGSGFLSHVCLEWERASRSIEKRGVRSCQARFGVVLGKNGGILQKLAPLYRWGLGARLGNGEQWLSWVALGDLILGIERLLEDETLRGPVNLVSPYPVRQEEFSMELSQAFGKKVRLTAPEWLLKGILGTMAEEMMLASARVRPAKLLEAGFSFHNPDLKETLKTIFAH
jgi:uncharacterized protein (TIGR01777 family)